MALRSSFPRPFPVLRVPLPGDQCACGRWLCCLWPERQSVGKGAAGGRSCAQLGVLPECWAPPSPSGGSVSSPVAYLEVLFPLVGSCLPAPSRIGCAGAGLGGSLSGGVAEGCRELRVLRHPTAGRACCWAVGGLERSAPGWALLPGCSGPWMPPRPPLSSRVPLQARGPVPAGNHPRLRAAQQLRGVAPVQALPQSATALPPCPRGAGRRTQAVLQRLPLHPPQQPAHRVPGGQPEEEGQQRVQRRAGGPRSRTAGAWGSRGPCSGLRGLRGSRGSSLQGCGCHVLSEIYT